MEEDPFCAKHIKAYKWAFYKVDSEHSGSIPLDRLDQALTLFATKKKIPMTPEKISLIVEEIRREKPGEEVTLCQFISTVMLKLQKVDSERELMEVFKIFDEDGDGNVTVEEFMKVCSIFTDNKDLRVEEVEEIIRWSDLNGDGKVAYKEFLVMMKNLG